MQCAFCTFAKPYRTVEAVMVIHGTSVCENHVDDASSEGFSRDLYNLHREEE